jgi:hypothetical protein
MYEWLQVLAGAASGDYRAADNFLTPIIAVREQVHSDFMRNRARSDTLYLTAAALLDTQFTPMTLYRCSERAFRFESLKLVASTKPQTADIYALRGILALEAGDNPRAAEMFRKVLELKDQGLVPVANYYLDLMEANK